MFGHKNNKQLWMLGAINTITKDFRIEGVLSSDAETLKKFITTYIPKGSNITTDGWVGYAFLNDLDSGYTHYTHNHGAGDFGLGFQSTSHVESLWSVLRHKIKTTYNVIPTTNIMHFIRETEFKYKIRNLSLDVKITKFFEFWKLLNNIKDVEIEKSEFYCDSDPDSDDSEDI